MKLQYLKSPGTCHRRTLLTLLQAALVVGVWCGAGRAGAKPMYMELKEVRALSVAVVVARLEGTKISPKGATLYQLKVEKVLGGVGSPGTWWVLPSPEGTIDISPGGRCVAFLDGKGQFRWVATPMKGHTLDDGLLQIRGFYDFNAYLVSPSLVTIPILEEYLRTGSLSYSFQGDLYFYKAGRGTPAPSSISLKVDYDPFSGAARISGMPTLRGFPATPKVRVSPGFSPDVTIEYESNLVRPLRIVGEVTRVDTSTGALQTRFWVDAPLLFLESEFTRYIRDATLGHPYFTLAVVLRDGTRYTLTLDKEIGRIGIMEGPHGERFSISSLSLAPSRQIEMSGGGGAYALLELEAPAPGLSMFEGTGTTGTLVQELLQAPPGCSLTITGGSSPLAKAPCTLTLVKAHFARN